jgi:O-antigen ligase
LFSIYSVYLARYDAVAASENGRVAGLVGHVTDAGGILSIALPFLVGMLIAGSRKWLTAAALATVGSALVLTGSVSGYLSGTGAVLITVWLSRRSLRLSAFAAVGAVIAGAAYFASRLQVESNLGISIFSRLEATTSGRYDTLASRQDTWMYAIERLVVQPLVGVGLDGASGVTVGELAVHNTWLLLWWQGGLLTLGGVVVFVAHVWSRAHLIPASDAWATSMKGSATAALMFSMTSPLAAQRYLWLPAILLLALAHERRSGAHFADQSGRWAYEAHLRARRGGPRSDRSLPVQSDVTPVRATKSR